MIIHVGQARFEYFNDGKEGPRNGHRKVNYHPHAGSLQIGPQTIWPRTDNWVPNIFGNLSDIFVIVCEIN